MPVTNPFKRAWLKTCALVHNLARLPETYWHILLCITVQGTLFIPLHEVIPEMMETEWGYTRAQSSQLFVYLHIIPIVLHLSLGIFINRIGHRLTLFLVGSVLVFLAALFITFIRQVPIMVSLIMMNFSGSFVPAAIFSMMNLVIDNGEVAGAALGLIRSAEFASVTLMEMLDGLLQDADHNRYDTVLIGLFVFAAILLAVAVASIIMDAKLNGGLLNSANPYKRSSSSPSPSPSPSTDNMLTSADRTDTKVTFYSDTQFQDSSSGIAEAEPRVPVRRYIYLAAIGVVLGMAWISFILSLTRT
ncbi:hypothetical protein GGI07_000051 [Coemansia sp. Benny D115]|nr:hypothetical protein GGI07_000051 [Coemansia sp. Benny D115]